jgi:hypothetical protein
MKLTGENRSTRGKTCPSTTSSTTWTDLGSNPGLRGGRPATNSLSHGTALPATLVTYFILTDLRDHQLSLQPISTLAIQMTEREHEGRTLVFFFGVAATQNVTYN